MTGRKIRNLKNNVAGVVSIFLLCLIYSSCEPRDKIYYQFKEIKNGTWSQHDTLVFDIDSSDVELNILYNVSVEITNNNDYPYRNLWLFVDENIDNDSIMERTNFEFELADELGKWNGSGFGALYQSSFALKEQIKFDDKRNYQIRLIHGMRDESLKGIEKVGINIFREGQ